MTDQTELFTPEIKAEAERLWKDACLGAYGHEANWRAPTAACSLALCRLLVATGFKPDVDPIEAKARWVVAERIRYDKNPIHTIDSIMRGESWKQEVAIARDGILAGMEMRKS